MHKKIIWLSNIVMGGFVGTYIGYAIYLWWDYSKNPGLYALQSSPWYTNILLYGIATAVIVGGCIAVKAVVKARLHAKAKP